MADQSVDMRFKFPHQMFLVGECQHLVLNKSLYILCFVRNIWWANIWSKSDENKWNNNVWCSPLHQVRSIISDFAVFFTILTMVLVDYALGIPSPKLQVPSVFKVRKISSPDLFDQQIANSQHFSASCCSCLTNNNTFFSPLFWAQPTRDDRGWFINPLGPNPWWTAVITVVPALLCTILIFMDQQITAVIINRKEHKLKVLESWLWILVAH